MSIGIIAFFLAAGSSGWLFTKLQNRTGQGNNQPAIIGAAVIFVIVFIVVWSLGQFLPKN